MTLLRTTPPPFDSRLIVLIDWSVARAPQGWASPAHYTARTLQARDTKAANWAPGALAWCYVEEVPALVASLTTPAAESDPALRSDLAAARERIAALETSSAQAIAALKQASP